MLKAGADFSDKTIEQLISLDAKNFDMGDKKVKIAQVNAVDTNEFFHVKRKLKKRLKQLSLRKI